MDPPTNQNNRKRVRSHENSPTTGVHRSTTHHHFDSFQTLDTLSGLATELLEGRIILTNEDKPNCRNTESAHHQVVSQSAEINHIIVDNGNQTDSDEKQDNSTVSSNACLSEGISSRTIYERFFETFTFHSNSHKTSGVFNCFVNSTQSRVMAKLKCWDKQSLLGAIRGGRGTINRSVSVTQGHITAESSTVTTASNRVTNHNQLDTKQIVSIPNLFAFANYDFKEVNSAQLLIIKQVIAKVYELLPDMVYTNGTVRVLDTINDQTRAVAPFSICGTVVMHTQLPANSSSSSNTIPISISFDVAIEGYHMVWFDIRNDHRTSRWDYHYFISKLTNNSN